MRLSVRRGVAGCPRSKRVHPRPKTRIRGKAFPLIRLINRNYYCFSCVISEIPTQNSLVNELGLVIKQLQRKHSLNGQELAKRIGITPPNLSQIVNGHAKPRQGTFTNLCKELGEDKADEKLLVDTFLRVKEGTPETIAVDPEEYQKTEIERAERFLEMKAQSIAFKRSVARELDKVGISYQQDYCEGIYVTDFLVERDGKRIALECKFNVQRDLSKSFTILGILREKLSCAQAYVVVPYAYDQLSDDDSPKPIPATELREHLK